ncbi:MAG: M23 family metallopeptidase [Nitriliruptorales bacterium]|nr:M23 family metallopeptidase [Nitriliruptorales bacterium]
MQKGTWAGHRWARSIRTSFAGLGTAFALGVSAMAAAAPVAVPGGEAPAGEPAQAGPDGVKAAEAPTAASAQRATAAAAPEAAATPEADSPTAAIVSDGHLGGRGLAIALAAAGRPVPGSVDAATVELAAATLGVELDDPVSEQDVRELARAAWKAATHQFTLAAIGPGEAPDPSDIREAAQRLGVKIEGDLTPGDVANVLAAGRADAADALAAVGFAFGDHVEVKEFERAAQELGLRYGEVLEPVDAKRVVFLARDKVKRAWEAQHQTPAFATASGVELRLPSHRVHYAGFHQAAYPVALPMARAGEAKTHIMASRGRGTSRASAIDIVQAPGEDVRSPVTGTVVEVTHYALYGKYPDIRMRIRPEGASHLLVSVLHMEGAKVRVGDHVEAGMTVIADGPRKFPFWSQVDGVSGRPWGHVHIEVKRR